MINSETLRTTVLAIGLAFLLMMVYASLKFNAYDASVYEYTLKNEKLNKTLEKDIALSTLRN